MFTFLRKIRKSLIESGKISKYLAYAIGEILLVVLGILIALQINNWNELRKERIMEIQSLNELADNIQLNIDAFESFSSGGKWADNATDYVLAVLNKEIAYTEKVDSMINSAIFRRNNLVYSNVAYEALKSTNLNLIRNNDLKSEIIQLFELTYPTMMNSFDWGGNESQPKYMDHHFYPTPIEDGMLWRPYDFSEQMEDNYFKSLLAKIKIQRNFYRSEVMDPLSESRSVLELINKELELID